MKKLIIPILVAGMFACGEKKTERKELTMLPYPKTKTVDQVDDYHGHKISDPYRWLENDTAADVKSWVEEENNVTQNYLKQIPFRDKIKNRLTEIWNYPKYSAPFTEGDYIFSQNDGLQNQSVLYFQKGEKGTPEVFLDPNKLSEDGTASLASFTISKDHKYAAVGIAQSGSDWNENICDGCSK
jgi:prolyl oligopeptidase